MRRLIAGIVVSVVGLALFAPAAGAAANGSGRVFLPNPVAQLQRQGLTDQKDADYAALQAAYRIVTLTNLDGSGYLRGDWANVRNSTGDLAFSSSLTFRYGRSDDRFEQVMAYYWVTEAQKYIQSLGFGSRFRPVNKESQDLRINQWGADNSYSWDKHDVLRFGKGGVDDAEDAEVILHEYGHAIHDSQVAGFGSSLEAGSIGEGFGDYWAVTVSNTIAPTPDPACVADWDVDLVHEHRAALPSKGGFEPPLPGEPDEQRSRQRDDLVSCLVGHPQRGRLADRGHIDPRGPVRLRARHEHARGRTGDGGCGSAPLRHERRDASALGLPGARLALSEGFRAPEAKWRNHPRVPGQTALPFGVSYETFRNGGNTFRVRLDGEDETKVAPHSAPDYWYANYESMNDNVLNVDGVSAAGKKVDFWTWYFIEEGWDFGYVEALVNGQWTTVPVTNDAGQTVSTSDDPHGNNTEGNGLTGTSGGAYFVDEPQYVHLNAQIPANATDVRFRYSTDAAYLDTGWFVDDVKVGGTPLVDGVNLTSPAGNWFRTDGTQDNNWVLQLAASCDLTPGATTAGEVREGGLYVYRFEGDDISQSGFNTRCLKGTKGRVVRGHLQPADR